MTLKARANWIRKRRGQQTGSRLACMGCMQRIIEQTLLRSMLAGGLERKLSDMVTPQESPNRRLPFALPFNTIYGKFQALGHPQWWNAARSRLNLILSDGQTPALAPAPALLRLKLPAQLLMCPPVLRTPAFYTAPKTFVWTFTSPLRTIYIYAIPPSYRIYSSYILPMVQWFQVRLPVPSHFRPWHYRRLP